MNHSISGTLILGSVLVLAGCGSSRDVKVSGDVASTGSASKDTIRVEFYEATSAGSADGGKDAAELRYLDAASVDEAGKFEKTVSVEGNALRVLAVVDADGNGECTDGEAWGQADVDVASDDTAKVSLRVEPHEKCPVLPAASGS